MLIACCSFSQTLFASDALSLFSLHPSAAPGASDLSTPPLSQADPYRLKVFDQGPVFPPMSESWRVPCRDQKAQQSQPAESPVVEDLPLLILVGTDRTTVLTQSLSVFQAGLFGPRPIPVLCEDKRDAHTFETLAPVPYQCNGLFPEGGGVAMVGIKDAQSDVFRAIAERFVRVPEGEEFVANSAGGECKRRRDVLAPGEGQGCLVCIGNVVLKYGVAQLPRECKDVFGARHLVVKVGTESVEALGETVDSRELFLMYLDGGGREQRLSLP